MKSKQTLQFDEKLIFTEIDEFEYFSRENSKETLRFLPDFPDLSLKNCG